MEESIQHGQTTQLTGLQTAGSGNIDGSTFPNSQGWTNIVSGTNIGGRSLWQAAKLDTDILEGARTDPDFETIHDHPKFRAMIEE